MASPLGAARLIAADIKLAHSVFALPFAILAAVMATPKSRVPDPFFWQLGLVVAAMFCARSAAMLANRLLDAPLDAANPRTAARVIPSGRLPPRTAALALTMCGAAFMGVCTAFGPLYGNWWPALLGLPVLAWICAYPLLKRFTALCHLYLGSSLALSPVAAAIAVNPHAVIEQPALWMLSGMVLCWVAGFDIIYALQDVDVDRAQGLYSAPSRFGVPQALWISRMLHAIATACLFAALVLDSRLQGLFAVGILMVAALLAYEHLTVARWGMSRIALAFFTLNGIISCLLGALGVADVLLG